MKNNWPTKKLGEVCEIIGGGTPRRGKPEYWNGTVPWLTVEDVNNKFYIESTKQCITQAGLEKSSARTIPPRSVILSCTASVGNVAINLVPLATNQQFNSFVCNKNLVPEFLALYLMFQKSRIESLGGSTTFRFISKSLISNLRVPLPPPPIQQKVVERLDAIRKAQDLNEKQISLTNELFRSLVHQELKPREGWERKELGNVAKVFNGKTAPRDAYTKRGIPILKVKNVQETGIILDDLSFVPPEFFHEHKKAQVIAGDILVVNAAHRPEYIGRCGLLNPLDSNTLGESIMCCGELMIIRCDQGNLHPLILNSLLKTPFHRRRVISLASPSTPHLYPKDMKKFKIPLPPLKTQHQIVEKLSAVQDYEKKLLHQKELLQELFNSTLDKAMKGELVK